MSTQVVHHTTILKIASCRDAALKRMQEATAKIEEGHRMADESLKMAEEAYGVATFTLKDHAASKDYSRIFERFDREASISAFRRQLDARVWMNVVTLTGMSDLMDRTAKEQLDQDLCGAVPEFSEDSARQVFELLLGDAAIIFQRGLARTFSNLDRRFKSHDGFKIGSRIILTHVFDDWGSFNHYSRVRDTLADVERVFAVLDEEKPNPGSLSQAIAKDRGGGWSRRQSVTETPYFRIRCFKNGNAHLWLLRDDLVEKANKMLAEYYGEVLPDAVPPNNSPEDLRTHTGLPAKDLSFYPTPEAVTKQVLQGLYIREGHRVLEPSAGTGNMVRHILAQGAQVDAIEIDPERVRALWSIHNPRLKVQPGNFLTMPATPEYDFVLMNPPFYGTHWMEHVIHAFDFLKPGGKLVAVLPVTAETGDSKKHETFRSWVQNHSRQPRLPFTDLPPESFVSSGTRINTLILTMVR